MKKFLLQRQRETHRQIRTETETEPTVSVYFLLYILVSLSPVYGYYKTKQHTQAETDNIYTYVLCVYALLLTQNKTQEDTHIHTHRKRGLSVYKNR